MISVELIADFLESRCGFGPANANWNSLSLIIEGRLIVNHCESVEKYLRILESSHAELLALMAKLVISETFFFRYPESYVGLAAWVKQAPVRPLRILSAACSTGEEAYSIAMSLLDAGLAPEDFIIEGRDLNLESINRAKHGVYSTNSFRANNLEWRDRYFEQHMDGWEIVPFLKGLVKFSEGNLLRLDDHGNWDIIFCRNVLIYFSREQQKDALTRLANALTDDGVLFLGPSEPPGVLGQGWSSTPYSMSFSCVKTKDLGGIKAGASPAPRLVTPRKKAVATPKAALQTRLVSEVEKRPTWEEASALADAGRLVEARVMFMDMVEAEPENVEANFWLGLVEEGLGQAASAERNYRRVLFLEATHPGALEHMSLLLRSQGRADAAKQLHRRISRLTSP